MSPITLTITLNTREWDPVASAFSSRKLVRLFSYPVSTSLLICVSVYIYEYIYIYVQNY